MSRRVVWGTVLLVAAIRVLFGANRHIYALSPDEYANAGMARFLAGGNWNMLRTNTWQPGLATLLAPLYTLTDDPELLVRLSLLVTSVLGGLSMLLLPGLVQRLTSFSPRRALHLSVVLAVSPASLVASAHVWAEPIVTLCFLGCLAAVLDLDATGRARSAVAAVVWAALGYLSHGRMLPLVGIAVVTCGVLLLRRRRVAGAAGIVALGGALVVGFDAYARWIFDQVWDLQSDANSPAGVLRRLVQPLEVLDSLVGQVWYLLAATGLLFGIGATAVVARAVRAGEPTRRRRDAVLILVLTTPLLATSVVFMAARTRPDHLFYGRYNEAVIWPVLAVAVDWLVRTVADRAWRPLAVTAGAWGLVLVETGLLLRQLHQRQLRVPSVVDDMVPGILPFLGTSRTVSVAAATIGGLLLAAVVVGAMLLDSRSRTISVTVVLAALCGLGVLTFARVAPGANVYGQSSIVTELAPDVLDPDVPVGVALMPDDLAPAEPIAFQTSYSLVYQWYLPDHVFLVDGGVSDDIGPYVFAPVNDAILSQRGGTIVWRDPIAGIALWREPDDG